MRPFRLALSALFASLGLWPVVAAAQTLTGTVTYLERIMLPPGAELEVVLEDISLQDTVATRLATYTAVTEGGPPWPFTLEVDPAGIDARKTYGLRATLRRDGKLLMTTTQVTPVLTRGAGTTAELILRRVVSDADAGTAPAPEAPLPAHGLALPATFTGTLPTASGAGVQVHLDLWPDQVFHLRETYVGEDGPPRDTLGRWAAEPEADRLVLDDARGTRYFAVEATDRLRQLDTRGQPIDSDLPYTLTATGTLDETDLALPLRGAFRYMADAALFEECMTGRSYPVAMEGDYLAMERAYLALAAQGAPVVAVVDGRLEMRPAMEGPDRRHLVVDRFAAFLPGLTCERARADSDLVNTYWRLISLDGTPVSAVPGRREPHLVLLGGDEPRWRATVGCNAMTGGWERTGAGTLRFGPGAMTMMACPPPLDATERALGQALAQATGARITGPLLELSDAEGTVRARFEAVYLR